MGRTEGTMSELLPCPFCGGGATIEVKTEWYDYDGGDRWWIYQADVMCDSCDAMMHVDHYKPKEFTDWATAEQFAIEAWNTRTAYETDDYFYLPKPKEPIAETVYRSIERTKNGYKVDAFARIIEENARKWGKEIDSFLIGRLCEVFRPERTCRNLAEPDETSDNPFYCSECGARDPYGEGIYAVGGCKTNENGNVVHWDAWPAWRY